MPDVLELIEKGRPRHLVTRDRDSSTEDSGPASVSNAKELYLQSARWLSKQAPIRSQRFWVPSHERSPAQTRTEPTTFTLTFGKYGPAFRPLVNTLIKRMTEEPRPAPAELSIEDFDPDQVAEFFSKGGKNVVVKFWRQLKRKQIPNDSLQALLEAFNEVSSSAQEEHSPGQPEAEPALATPEEFVLRASRLERAGHRNAAMDLLYDRIDELMRTGQFDLLDMILQRVPVREFSVDVLLGLLTATLPARSRLPSREDFFSETEQVLRERAEYEEGLLTGLE